MSGARYTAPGFRPAQRRCATHQPAVVLALEPVTRHLLCGEHREEDVRAARRDSGEVPARSSRLYVSTSVRNESRSKWSPESSTIVSASPAWIARAACWSSWIPEAPPLPSSISQRGRRPSFQARSIARSGVCVNEATPSPSTAPRVDARALEDTDERVGEQRLRRHVLVRMARVRRLHCPHDHRTE